MFKKIIFFLLTCFFLIFSLSAAIEFLKLFKNYSITTKIEFFFIAGFVLYLLIHIVFYKPVFIHIMSHELTHMLWAFLFGGKTKKIEVSENGGKVIINKSNFLISLAPYFFPFYTFIFILIYLIADKKFYSYIAFFIGGSLSFHIALTLYSLRQSQSDLKEDSNIVFSLSFIFFMNIIIIVFILALLSPKINFISFIKNSFSEIIILCKEIILKINNLLK